MPPTADASLLTPTGFSDSAGDGGSDRNLDEIGAVVVLGAMVEQRKRTASVPDAIELDSDADAVATQRRPRLDPNDDLFQKIR